MARLCARTVFPRWRFSLEGSLGPAALDAVITALNRSTIACGLKTTFFFSPLQGWPCCDTLACCTSHELALFQTSRFPEYTRSQAMLPPPAAEAIEALDIKRAMAILAAMDPSKVRRLRR